MPAVETDRTVARWSGPCTLSDDGQGTHVALSGVLGD